MDRGIEQLKTTIARVEGLLESLQDVPSSEFDHHGQWYIENFLTGL